MRCNANITRLVIERDKPKDSEFGIICTLKIFINSEQEVFQSEEEIIHSEEEFLHSEEEFLYSDEEVIHSEEEVINS